MADWDILQCLFHNWYAQHFLDFYSPFFQFSYFESMIAKEPEPEIITEKFSLRIESKTSNYNCCCSKIQSHAWHDHRKK